MSRGRTVIVLLPALLICVLMPAGSISASTGSPLQAVAQWKDNAILYGGEGLAPCSEEPAAAICIEAAWMTTAAGQRIDGQPLVEAAGGENGWFYDFPRGAGVDTYWLSMTRTPGDDAYGHLYITSVITSPPASIPDGGSCWLQDAALDGGPLYWCAAELKADQRFGVTLRTSLEPAGWVDARMGDAEVSLTAARNKQPRRLTIEGTSVRIPTLRADFSYDDPRDRADWSRLVAVAGRGSGDSHGIIPPDWPSTSDADTLPWAPFPALTPFTFTELAKLMPDRLRRATGWVTVWRAQTYFVGTGEESECTGEFSGLTSSTAMTYDQFIDWDAFTREIPSTMAGPTYDADGKRLTGDFSLVMTDKAASCLWGWNGQGGYDPIDLGDQIRIQVINEDGVEAVATSSVKRRDGLIRVTAAGFSFSMKKVVLKQVTKGAPARPQKVRASVKGSTLKVKWPAKSGLTYRMRVTTGDGTQFRVIREETVKGGSAVFQGLSKGRYRVELIALNARGQSTPTRAAATIR